MAIEWSDDLLVGHDAINRQHRENFKSYNAFLSACKAGKSRVTKLLVS